MKGHALLSEIQDEDLLPLLHSASQNILKKEERKSRENSKNVSCWSKLTVHGFNTVYISNNVQNIPGETTYIYAIDVFRSIAAIWLLLFRIAYYLSQTYGSVLRKNKYHEKSSNDATASSAFSCLDFSLLIHADLAFDILLLVSGFLISRPWYLYFVKMIVDNDNKIVIK